MKRVFGIGTVDEDWINDCSAHVGGSWVVTAKSWFLRDEDIQLTTFHPYLLTDKEMFLQTLIHEICECDLLVLILNTEVILLKPFATITHYCTVHALDEPDKDYTLPW